MFSWLDSRGKSSVFKFIAPEIPLFLPAHASASIDHFIGLGYYLRGLEHNSFGFGIYMNKGEI